MDQGSKSRTQLALAGQLFNRNDYAQCRKVLTEIKEAHASSELNLLLCEYKEAPQKAAAILRKLMDILIALNIKLYEERPPQPQRAPRISHELYYWNMAVLAGVTGSREMAELIVTEALHFTDSLRLETSLMLIYQMLNAMLSAGRLASCIALIDKQNRLLDRVRNTSKEEQTYRFTNQLLFNRVLLKLGMVEGSRIMYSMRFARPDKENPELADLSGVPLCVHQHLLNAEIEFTAQNYPLATKILGEMQTVDAGKSKELVKSMADHNLALILTHLRKPAAAQLLFKRTLNYLSSAKELSGNNQRSSYIGRCRENIMLSGILTLSPGNQAQLFEAMRACPSSSSFKLNYRKAQSCLALYHQLLTTPPKLLPYHQIHDFYEPTYFHPNQPYFQQKGKNKNPTLTSGRSYYRRYVLPHAHPHSSPDPIPDKEPESLQKEKQELKKKEGKSKGKKEDEVKVDQQGKGETQQGRLREVLTLADWYLKQALAFLEKEKSIIVNLQGEEKGLTEQVNQKLYSEYIDFKANIYCLLCYVSVCRCQWSKAITYASLYQDFEKQYQLQGKSSAHQQIYYNVLTYQMEAYSELGRTHKAYDLMQHVIHSIEYASSLHLQATTTATDQPYIETMSQYHNFCHNIAVLHSRDNKIPEAFQAIQKLLQVMRVSPSSPQARLPQSMIDLLVHYNLRTGNQQSALQVLKRRRMLNVGVMPQYQPILSITK